MNKFSYYDMNKCLCKELECEFAKFEADKSSETFYNVKSIVETMVGLTELEAAGAMREYLEDEHGYDSRSGDFRKHSWGMPYNVYNVAKRYPMMDGGMYPNPTYTGLPYGGGYYGMGDEYMNRGGRDGDRGGRGRSYNDGRGDYQNGGRDGDYMNDGRGGYNRGRSRDSRGRYNEEGYGIYNMAHMKEKVKKMTDHDYDKWLEEMQGADGSMGPMWTEEETSSIAKKIGVEFKEFTPKEFQVAMDMVYSDYCEVFDKYGMNKPEVYAEIAKAWLEDEDTIKGGEKLSAYHEYIVEK